MNTPTGCILARAITDEHGDFYVDHSRWRDYPGFHVVCIGFKGAGGCGRTNNYFFEPLEEWT